ncbi:MAG: DUF4469 domain-containing protein [Prevotellaceae bacterium]|jgi:hypothetical protein|nr:DUF4469 domain-containing protein [Prevotellaceae bacterium]
MQEEGDFFDAIYYFVRLGVADSGALIAQVMDVKTGSVDDLLTPNRNLKIAGYKIKIIGNKPEVGIYFTNTATGARVKVDNSDIVVNNPSEVMIVTPALPVGTYKLEISTQYAVGSLLNAPRTALFNKTLTVQ